MSRKTAYREPGAMKLVEQAVHMLRSNSGLALAEYYLGALPFILALLYFWSDMSRNAMADRYCGPSAAGVALLFIWMKVWQVRFCRRLWCRLQGVPQEIWPWRRMVSTAARQALIHAVGLVLLLLAALIALPLGWVYAFYQNVCVLDGARTRGLAGLARAAREQAALWPGQNHLALTIISVFGVFVFFNLALGVLAVPYLLKWLLGIETVFTLSGARLLNTTFLAVLCALTYLCVDPVIKSFYVLRCFYGRSLQTGDDLRAGLRPFMRAGLLVISLLLFTPWHGMAQGDMDETSPAAETLAERRPFCEQLDAAIESVLQQRRFAWRLPRQSEPEAEQEQGWITGTLQWLADIITSAAQTVGGWIKSFLDWLKERMPETKFPDEARGGDYRAVIRWVFYGLGFCLAILLIHRLACWLRHSRRVAQDVPAASAQQIDLADESVSAQDLPLDQWMTMARDLLGRNDFRHALRALYLSVLALLAEHRWVTIARYKSNLDYARELARHSHAEPELLAAFDWCMQLFERVWYGLHPVARPQVHQFMDQQKRIADLVQRTA